VICFAIKLSKVSNIYKLSENYSQFLSFPLLLHGIGTTLPDTKKIIPVKTNDVRIKFGMCKWSIGLNGFI
jgi:hypothetical protein